MTAQSDPTLAEFCRIIEANIGEFVEELRAIDPVDLISFIRFESFPTVEDLVNSSTELFFKPEMLVFSWAAGVDLRWDAVPVVTLGLEFRHPTVSVFFNLTMRDAHQSVEILGIRFEREHQGPREDLARAFTEARLPDGAGPPIPLLQRPVERRTRRGLPWA